MLYDKKNTEWEIFMIPVQNIAGLNKNALDYVSKLISLPSGFNILENQPEIPLSSWQDSNDDVFDEFIQLVIKCPAEHIFFTAIVNRQNDKKLFLWSRAIITSKVLYNFEKGIIYK
jgi:hypothetical protein